MLLQVMKSPCTSSGKWREYTNSEPEVGRERFGTKSPARWISTPYGILEAGGGLYRTNGNQCARTKQNAFTAMAVVGLRYNLDTRSPKPAGEENSPYGANFCVGAELGYFFIRDVFKNVEISLRGNYFPKIETASVNFGFKMFLNLKAGRS
jgi:hypothetical protein